MNYKVQNSKQNTGKYNPELVEIYHEKYKGGI